MVKRIFVDTETTGLTEQHGVWQIAVAVMFEGTLKCEREFKCSLHPGDLVEEEALRVGGVTEIDLAGMDPPDLVFQQLTELLNGYVNPYDQEDKFLFYGFNAGFDWMMLRSWFRKCGATNFGAYFHTPPIDVAALAAERLARHRPKMKSFKQSSVARWLDIPVDDTKLHDALYDIGLCVEIYRRV